jgi:hypothetical protein
VPSEVKLSKVRFEKRDGGTTEEYNTIQHYLRGSGKGKPRAEDFQTQPPAKAASSGLHAQGFCGLGQWVDVRMTISQGGITLPLRNTKIGVFDENPWLASSVVAIGTTDSGGWYHFQQPACDWGAWWDYSQPDLYFVVSSETGSGSGAFNMLGSALGIVYSYSVRTGTFWDNTSNNIQIDIPAYSSSSSQGLWVHAVTAHATAFNVATGSAGATSFPYRVSWPSNDIVIWGGAITSALGISGPGTSHAYISRIELLGEHWGNLWTILHEFGHEVMYYTAKPTSYIAAASGTGWMIPGFHFGSHGGFEQEIYDLAYNEGWATYFANSVARALGPTAVSQIPNYTRRADLDSRVHKNGGENEFLVSTFLYRYMVEVLAPASGGDIDGSFGKIRGSLMNAGRYDVDIHQAWPWWIKSTMPSGAIAAAKIRQIAIDSYMDLSRIP